MAPAETRGPAVAGPRQCRRCACLRLHAAPETFSARAHGLALCALANHYGKHVVFAGPTYKSADRLSGQIRIHFTHTDGGLVAKGGKLAEFSIAGDDHKWYWAEARIEGDAIIVSSPSVPNPKEVRYAWQSNPEATLFNGAGLPAVPFRTDNWPGITENVRPY